MWSPEAEERSGLAAVAVGRGHGGVHGEAARCGGGACDGVVRPRLLRRRRRRSHGGWVGWFGGEGVGLEFGRWWWRGGGESGGGDDRETWWSLCVKQREMKCGLKP